jgi:hypothetical protein
MVARQVVTPQTCRSAAGAIVILGTSLTFCRGAAVNQKLIDDVRRLPGLRVKAPAYGQLPANG